MRVGQTALVVFISKLLGSVLGFIATLVFAQALGAKVLGYYSIILAVVAWLKIGGDLGVSLSVSKRISEGNEPNEYFTAGMLILGLFAVTISIGIVAARDVIDGYIGVESWYFVIPLFLTGLLLSFIRAVLNGERRVHISGILTPVNLTISSLAQIALVLMGFGLTGMILGYFIGEILVGTAAVALVSLTVSRPTREHLTQIYDFAKYSWLGSVKLKSFNNVDILVLGALVPSSLVGIYSVAWSLSKFLTLFGHAVRTTIFPEISHADASDDGVRISNLATDSMAFIGLIAIPGLFGGLIIGDLLLLIYGQEFTQGTTVLGLLILATLVYSYQQQMLAIIKGIDRPEIAFRVNAVFLSANVILNIILVVWIGWVGAAIATVASAVVGLVLAFHSLRKLVDFDIPIRELASQLISAGIMGAVVYVVRNLLESSNVARHTVLFVLILVVIGAAVYFLSLTIISTQFREKLVSNAPVEVPF